MKKTLVVAILLGTILSTNIVGCRPTKEPAEPTVFSVLYNEREATPLQQDWLILEEYQKRHNVVLDVRLANDADYEKATIQTLESGNMPDIILKVWPDPIKSYASTGVLLPFSDYENLMPNFMAYVKEHGLESELDNLRLDNGKYYVLPGYQREIQVQQWIYRRDIFERHNLEIPKTYDELFDSLVHLKEIYPDSTPITASWGGAHLFAMMGTGYGIPAGWNGTRYYNSGENRWQFAPATENYQALYGFLNRCYRAGILDPAIFTQEDTDYINKLTDGRALVTVTWITSGFGSWNETLEKNGFPDAEWAALPVPESTIGIKALPPVNPFRKGLVVPSRVINEPYFKDLLAFLDWAVYSQEGMTLTTWGVEGTTFEDTPDGKAFLPDIQTPKNPGGTLDATKEYGLDTLFNLNENAEFEDFKKPPEIVAFLDESLKAQDTAEMAPPLELDSNTIEAIRIIDERITPYVVETSGYFVTGELDINKDWDRYLLELEKRGYKTLEEIWNAAWAK
jgi:putative aldouronate transport system substrate-binding protein